MKRILKHPSILICVLFFSVNFYVDCFAQDGFSESPSMDGVDSIAKIYADTSQKIEIGTMHYFFEYEVHQDTTKRPYKIGFYNNGTDTAFYFDGMKIGYRVDLHRGDEINPRWISLGTFPRGYTFGASYHYYEKKHSYYEAYAGIFGMIYPNMMKMFSAGANYTRFFCRKEKPSHLYQAVLPWDHKFYSAGTPIHYQSRIGIVKNIHWGLQGGFSIDIVNGERADEYFYAGNQSFHFQNARSVAALVGLTRFVVKNMQLSFGEDGKRKLKGANFRRLSFALAYYPLLELKYEFYSAIEGLTPDMQANPRDSYYGKPFGWKIVWDGRLAFWGRRNFGIVYRYGVEQTPFRQYGRNGLVPIAAGGIFFNVGSAKKINQIPIEN